MTVSVSVCCMKIPLAKYVVFFHYIIFLKTVCQIIIQLILLLVLHGLVGYRPGQPINKILQERVF